MAKYNYYIYFSKTFHEIEIAFHYLYLIGWNFVRRIVRAVSVHRRVRVHIYTHTEHGKLYKLILAHI